MTAEWFDIFQGIERFIRDLGEGHRYAPGAEPTFGQEIMIWLANQQIDLREVLWLMVPAGLFLALVWGTLRLLRTPRSRKPASRRHDDIDVLIGYAGAPHDRGAAAGHGSRFGAGLDMRDYEMTEVEVTETRSGDMRQRKLRALLRQRTRD